MVSKWLQFNMFLVKWNSNKQAVLRFQMNIKEIQKKKCKTILQASAEDINRTWSFLYCMEKHLAEDSHFFNFH